MGGCKVAGERSGRCLFTFGLLLMLLGLFRQEAGLVLQKAIVLCLQCIGIG